MNPLELATTLRQRAWQIGFDLVGITSATRPDGFDELTNWLDRGYAGEMAYIERRRSAYEHPRYVLDGARSVIMLAINYRTEEPDGSGPGISRYAWGDGDYHDLLRGKLKQLAEVLHEHQPGCQTRGVVDTAPLLERDFARLSGLGWFGKNTMLINKRRGSWLFLCALLTDVELPIDEPHQAAHCGTCTRCLEACPTDAFPAPYVLDARRCISYLTIELRDQPIPLALREGMGDWVFGCDVCQDVCPWNRKAPVSSEETFQPRDDLYAVDPIELLQMDDDEFHRRFDHTPLARTGRAAILRNVCIALGNRRQRDAVPALADALNDNESLIRGAAAWALSRIGNEQALAALRDRLAVEDDPQVGAELSSLLAESATQID